MAVTLPHYEDLEWRLDVQLASRALRGQVEPSYFLKLKLLTPGQFLPHSRTQIDAAAGRPTFLETPDLRA